MKFIKTPSLREKTNSLRFRSMVLVAMPFLVLTLFLVFYVSYAVSVVREHSYEVNFRSLDIYMNGVDESMKDAEKYALSLYSSPELLTLSTTGDSVEYYKAVSRLQTDMTSAAQSYKYIDSLFVYDEGRGLYIDGAKYALSSQERNRIKAMVLSEIGRNDELLAGKWYPAENDGEHYLVRFFRVRDSYFGCAASVRGLCRTMQEDGYSDYDYLNFFTQNGTELGTVLPEMAEPLELSAREAEIGGDKYILLSRELEIGDFFAVALIDHSRTLEGLRSFGYIIVLLILVLAAFLIVFTMIMRRWVTKPIESLCEGMNKLKMGDLDVRLSTGEEPCSEFALLNGTFDDMSENIKRLKIDVYEQNLKRQESELQYMKAQFKPHFYINCFNAINNLAIMNRTAQISEMTKYLGNEMRYIMGSKTVDTLSREVEFTENYLRIQELCYGDSVRANFEIEPSVRDVPVPPLVILTFVGNVFKHQATPGESIDVFVVCSRSEEDPERIKIEIWDTGEGFPEDVLVNLSAGGRIIDDRGEHFGIRNIISRIGLIYGERADISIQNHFETGGAYISIELPDDGGISAKESTEEL